MADPRAVLTRPASPPDAVVRYGSSREQIADLRLPNRMHAPLVLLLHGGFWRSTYDRVHTRPMADGLVEAGFAVATPEYARTGAGGGWPATFDDVALAVATLPAQVAAAAGDVVDPTRIVLVGHSAGGHLALWRASEGMPAAFVGVIALAPVADLVEAFRLDLDRGAVAALLGATPDQAPDRYDRADPCLLPPPSIPVVVLHGADDTQVPPALSERYATHGGAELHVLPGIEHYGLIDPRSSAWPVLLDVVGALCRRPSSPPR